MGKGAPLLNLDAPRSVWRLHLRRAPCGERPVRVERLAPCLKTHGRWRNGRASVCLAEGRFVAARSSFILERSSGLEPGHRRILRWRPSVASTSKRRVLLPSSAMFVSVSRVGRPPHPLSDPSLQRVFGGGGGRKSRGKPPREGLIHLAIPRIMLFPAVRGAVGGAFGKRLDFVKNLRCLSGYSDILLWLRPADLLIATTAFPARACVGSTREAAGTVPEALRSTALCRELPNDPSHPRLPLHS